MFLVGGPAFCGKTLLAHLLTQGRVVCLDEPDFHDPVQRVRGVAMIRERAGDAELPPEGPITHEGAVAYLEACERVLALRHLGMKTSDWTFVRYAELYAERRCPVIALVRDVRDVLTEGPLPEWVTEDGLVERYQLIWRHRAAFDLCIRYEDLVSNPRAVFSRIAECLSVPLEVPERWPAATVSPLMMKLPKHEMLKRGEILRTQVGLWRSAPRRFSSAVRSTAAMMGY